MTQTYFEETFGYLVSPDQPKEVKTVTESYYPYLQCPYCLKGSYSLNDWIVVNKKGNISKKMAWCPRCHVTLRRKTLVHTGSLDLIEYGKYLASLAQYDVDKRIKWTIIFQELDKVSYEERSKMWEAYRAERSRVDPFYAARQEEKRIEKEAEQYEREYREQEYIERKSNSNK